MSRPGKQSAKSARAMSAARGSESELPGAAYLSCSFIAPPAVPSNAAVTGRSEHRERRSGGLRSWTACASPYGRCLSRNPRAPMTMESTSECVRSANRPWSALFRVSPQAVSCLFSVDEITST